MYVAYIPRLCDSSPGTTAWCAHPRLLAYACWQLNACRIHAYTTWLKAFGFQLASCCSLPLHHGDRKAQASPRWASKGPGFPNMRVDNIHAAVQYIFWRNSMRSCWVMTSSRKGWRSWRLDAKSLTRWGLHIGMSQRSVSMLHEVHLLKVPAFSFLDVKRQVVSEEEVGSHNKLVSAWFCFCPMWRSVLTTIMPSSWLTAHCLPGTCQHW